MTTLGHFRLVQYVFKKPFVAIPSLFFFPIRCPLWCVSLLRRDAVSIHQSPGGDSRHYNSQETPGLNIMLHTSQNASAFLTDGICVLTRINFEQCFWPRNVVINHIYMKDTFFM